MTDVDTTQTGHASRVRARMAKALTLGGYRTGAVAARVVPGFIAAGLAAPFAAGANLANSQRRSIVARNLQRVDPSLQGAQLRRAVQASFDSYATYFIESFRLPNLSSRTVERGLTVEGYDHVLTGLEQGNGVILALPHLGGWEWAGRWVADQGHTITVVVERIEPPELFEWFAELRADLGMKIVPLGPSAGREVLAALRNNEVVCLLSDRDIDRSGIPVEFFGETTTLPAGPATISLRTGAPVLPAAVYYTGRVDGHLGRVLPPITIERSGKFRTDVTTFTQILAHEFEHLIRAAPSQWHLFQPNWPSDPGYDGKPR